jgi:hypothetical protein
MTKPDNFMELYAWCVNNTMTGPTDGVHVLHLYRVDRFVTDDDRFYPSGVRLRDHRGNELTETFYMQQFIFFMIYMN